MISCNVPSEQTDEQYTLPKIRVIMLIKIKPAAEKLNRLMKFNREGINCRKRTDLKNCIDNETVKSRNNRSVEIKKRMETQTRIRFSNFHFMKL